MILEKSRFASLANREHSKLSAPMMRSPNTYTRDTYYSDDYNIIIIIIITIIVMYIVIRDTRPWYTSRY